MELVVINYYKNLSLNFVEKIYQLIDNYRKDPYAEFRIQIEPDYNYYLDIYKDTNNNDRIRLLKDNGFYSTTMDSYSMGYQAVGSLLNLYIADLKAWHR